MSEQIIQVLDEIAARFGIAIDWTQTNVVPYLQELMGRYVQYRIIESTITAISMVLVSVLFIALTIFLLWRYKVTWDNDKENLLWLCGCAVSGVIGTIVIIGTLVTVPACITTIISCATIPELQMLNLLQSFG